MQRKLTKEFLNSVKPGAAELIVWDTAIKGFGFRVTPLLPHGGGKRSFLLKYRTKAGKVRKPTIGGYPDLTFAQARQIAGDWKAIIANGGDPILDRNARAAAISGDGPVETTVKAVAKNFIKRYAKQHQRTWQETERVFDHYVLPVWGSRQIHSITRGDVSTLLDKIEDQNGPVMADRTLAHVRKMINWHMARDDRMLSPIVRGMARTKPKERARDRVLTDGEIRALWASLESFAPAYGPAVKFILLSAQRPGEVFNAGWADIDAESLWTIDAEKYKTARTHTVPLSKAAAALVAEMPRAQKATYIFSMTGKVPFQGLSKAKSRLDEAMLKMLVEEAQKAGADVEKVKLPRWTLHDLRRTAKTLMVRAGVRPDISERVLGHVIAGVEGTYDRHSYLDEKRAALETLARTVDLIIKPPKGNVVALRAG